MRAMAANAFGARDSLAGPGPMIGRPGRDLRPDCERLYPPSVAPGGSLREAPASGDAYRLARASAGDCHHRGCNARAELSFTLSRPSLSLQSQAIVLVEHV